MQILTAYYDLHVSPVSWDFFKFMVGAKIALNVLGGDQLHVVFVPAANEGGFREDKKPISRENKLWRLHNLCVPICRLFDATYVVSPLRINANKGAIWPPDWASDHPVNLYWFGKIRKLIEDHGLPALTPDAEAVAWVKEWAGPEPYVTITLRETYAEVRNADKPEWLKFKDWLEGQGQRVIVVPDTQQAGRAASSPLGAVAALNPLVRHALYSGARMNLGIGGGPMCLCWFGGLPFVSLKMLGPYYAATREHYARWGLPVGTQLPWATDKQLIAWQDDTFDNIKAAYQKVMN